MGVNDLTQFCRETNETHKSVGESEFREIWCKRCRNQECKFSTWGKGAWLNRMETQVDTLLDNPLFGDPRQEQFRHLQDVVFEDMKHHAVALHLANQNQDWEIPSEQKVSDIIKGDVTLSREIPIGFQKESLSDTISGDFKGDDALTEDMEIVSAQDHNAEEELPRLALAPSISHSLNTEISDGGIILGDEQGISPVIAVTDDWSVPAPVENIVPVGGRVVMGNPKGDKK